MTPDPAQGQMTATSAPAGRRVLPARSIDPRGRELQLPFFLIEEWAAAEGATAPETLRQKGRGSDDNAGKRGFDSAADGVSALSGDVNLSGTSDSGGAIAIRDAAQLSEWSCRTSRTHPLKTTPLHGLHTRLGARMAEFGGYDMPIQYADGIMAEHNWTRTHAGLFDVSHMGPSFLSLPQLGGGDEAHRKIAAIVERLVPSDIAGLAPGKVQLTVLLNENGGIIDDLMIGRPPRDDQQGMLYIVVNAGHEGERLRADREGRGRRGRTAPRRRSRADRPAGTGSRGGDRRHPARRPSPSPS